MDPVTLAILAAAALGGGGQTFESIPAFIPTKYDKLNKQKLAELQALEASGDLGMSAMDKHLMNQNLTEPTLRALDNRLLPSSNAMGFTDIGSDYAKLLAAQNSRAALAGDVQSQAYTQVRAADKALTDQQVAEIEQREAYRSDRNREKLEAALAIPAAALDSAMAAQGFQQMARGKQAATPTPTEAPPSIGTNTAPTQYGPPGSTNGQMPLPANAVPLPGMPTPGTLSAPVTSVPAAQIPVPAQIPVAYQQQYQANPEFKAYLDFIYGVA